MADTIDFVPDAQPPPVDFQPDDVGQDYRPPSRVAGPAPVVPPPQPEETPARYGFYHPFSATLTQPEGGLGPLQTAREMVAPITLGLGAVGKSIEAGIGRIAGTGDTFGDIEQSLLEGTPLPVEQATAKITGIKGALARGGLGIAETLPKLAAMSLVPGGIIAQSVAAGGLFGFDPAGNFSVKGAAIGALLPGAGNLAKGAVARALVKGVASGSTALANPTAQWVLEEMGQQAALNTVMMVGDSPEIIALYQQDPAAARNKVQEIVGQNMAWALFGGAHHFLGGGPTATEAFIRKNSEKYGDAADAILKRRISKSGLKGIGAGELAAMLERSVKRTAEKPDETQPIDFTPDEQPQTPAEAERKTDAVQMGGSQEVVQGVPGPRPEETPPPRPPEVQSQAPTTPGPVQVTEAALPKRPTKESREKMLDKFRLGTPLNADEQDTLNAEKAWVDAVNKLNHDDPRLSDDDVFSHWKQNLLATARGENGTEQLAGSNAITPSVKVALGHLARGETDGAQHIIEVLNNSRRDENVDSILRNAKEAGLEMTKEEAEAIAKRNGEHNDSLDNAVSIITEQISKSTKAKAPTPPGQDVVAPPAARVEALEEHLDSPEATSGTRKQATTQTGLAVTDVSELDKLVALREKYAEISKDKSKSPDERMAASVKAQAASEAIQVATDTGSQVEAEIQPGLPKLGPRPLDWRTHPEVVDWLKQNAEKLGVELPEELKPKLAAAPAKEPWQMTADTIKVKQNVVVPLKRFGSTYEDTPTLNVESGSKLGDIIDAPALFNQYPSLADIKVSTVSDWNGMSGYRQGRIRIVSDTTGERQITYLIHELQHAIQDLEGKEPGASYLSKGYREHPSEVEARATASIARAIWDQTEKDYLQKLAERKPSAAPAPAETARLSYGEKYVKEQGVEGAQKRLDYLDKEIYSGKRSSREIENLADEANNIRKAIEKAKPAEPTPAAPATGTASLVNPPVEPAADLGQGLPEGQGMRSEAEVRQAVAGVDTAGMRVNVITREQAAQLTGRPEARGYGGFYWPENGQIYLVRDNISRLPEHLDQAKALLREEVGHGLLRTGEGKRLLNAFIERGRLNLTESEKQALRDKGYQEHQLLDEFIAKSARENLPWWRKAVERVRVWLSKMGLANLTNEEAARLLLRQIRAKNDFEASGVPATGIETAPAPGESTGKSEPAVADEELKRRQELGRKGIGAEHLPTKIAEVVALVQQHGWNGHPPVTPERTAEAYALLQRFLDPHDNVATELAEKTQARGSGVLQTNELWNYAFQMVVRDGDAKLLTEMLANGHRLKTEEFVDFGAVGYHGSALDLRLHGELLRNGLVAHLLVHSKAQLAAAGRVLGEGSEGVQNLIDGMKEIGSRLDPEEWDKLILTGKGSKGRTLADILEQFGPEGKGAEEVTSKNVPDSMPQRGKVYKTVHRYLVDSNYWLEDETRFRQDLKADLMTALGADLAKHNEYDRLAGNIANDAWLRKTMDMDKRTHRLMDAEYRKLDTQASRTAETEIRKLNDLKLPTGVPNKVREILRDFLKSSRPIGMEADFRKALQSALFAAGVPHDRAIILARDIYNKRVTDSAHARVVAMERASKSGRVVSLIEDIKNAPYLLQQDPNWRFETARQWFMSNGLGAEPATAAANLFTTEFNKRYEEAAMRVAQQLLRNKTPKTMDDLVRAIRVGLSDPSRRWPDALAERAGFKGITLEQHQRLAELEQKRSAPQISPEEQVAYTEQMMGIMRHTGDQSGHFLKALGESFAASLLSGIKTTTLHIFQPPMSMLADLFIHGAANPQDFPFLCQQTLAALKTWWPSARYAWTHDAYSFSVNQRGLQHNELKRQFEIAQREWSAGQYHKAIPRFAIGYQHNVMRALMTANQAAMRVVQRWKLALYGSQALRQAGYGSKEIGQMVDYVTQKRKAAYELALLQHPPTDAAAIADHWANEEIVNFISNRTGDPMLAQRVSEAGFYEPFSRVGRMVPGIREMEEGFLSNFGPNQMIEFTKNMRRAGGPTSILNIMAFGFMNIPLRLARYMANYGPYGLVRSGVHQWMQNPNHPGATGLRRLAGKWQGKESADTFWQQSYSNNFQAQARLREAIAGTGLLLAFGAWQHYHHTSDDDAEKKPFALFVTGHGPSNKTMRDSWTKRGFKPFSLNIIIGGEVRARIPITRVGEVFAYPLGLAAAQDDLAWRVKQELATGRSKPEGLAREMASIAGTYYEVVGAQGILQSFSRLTKLGEGEGMGRALQAEAGSLVGGLLPWHGLLNSVENIAYGSVDRSSAEAAMLANIPVLNAFTNGRAINRFGDPVGDKTWFGRLEQTGIPLAFRVADTPENKAMYQMILKTGAAPPDLRRYLVEDKYGPLTQTEWNKFTQLSGDKLKAMVLQNMAGLDTMAPQDVKAFMNQAGEAANAQAASELGLAPQKGVFRNVAGGAAGGSGVSSFGLPGRTATGLPSRADMGLSGQGGAAPNVAGAGGSVLAGSAFGGVSAPHRIGLRRSMVGGGPIRRLVSGARRGSRFVSGRVRTAGGGRLRRISVGRRSRGRRIRRSRA